MNIACVVNSQFAHNGAASSSYIYISSTPQYTLDSFFSAIENGTLTTYNGISNNIRDGIKDQCNWLISYNYDCDYVPSGWSYDLHSCLNFSGFNSSDIDNWNANYAGRRLHIKLHALFSRNGVNGRVPYYLFDKVLPTLESNVSSLVLVSDSCLDNTYSQIVYTRNDFSNYTNPFMTSELAGGSLYEYSLSGTSNCYDVRTSTGTNECLITFNYLDVDEVQQSDTYDLFFQPDSNHTSGQINNLNLYRFTSIVGASAHFVGGSVRRAGIITVRGKITGTKLGYTVLGESIPGVRVVEENVILLQASFSPCCDWPDSYSETYSDVLAGIYDGADAVICTCEITSIEWSGFANLENYCCDDSDCSQNSFEYPPNSLVKEGNDDGGGDGGSVDITCICDNLENLISMLSSKLDFIVSAINGLELTATVEPCSPTITVEPATPSITVSPANPTITVSPANPTITVSPATPSITVSPANPTITVSPCQPTIQNVINEGDVSLDNSDLIDKLDELFNTSGDNKENITDVLKNKDIGNHVEVEVTPNELVSLRKVFYENFDDN